MPRVLAATAAATLTAALLAGCGGDRPEATSPQSPSAPSAPSAPRATARSEPPTPAPRTTPGRDERSRERGRQRGGKMEPSGWVVARAGGARGRLLAAAALPPVSSEQAWTERRTRAEGRRHVGACQRTPLVDIGALQAVVRTFDGPEGLRSRQVVAHFADKKSAWRAHEVVRSWHADCAEVLDEPAQVGPWRRVRLAAGHGDAYRADHGEADAARRTALGVHRRGSWLSLVAVTASGDAATEVPARWPRRAVRLVAELS